MNLSRNPRPPLLIQDSDIINYSLNNDIEFNRNLYQLSRRIKIDNILLPEFAEYLYKYISNEKNWYLACGIDSVRYENKLDAANKKKNDELGNRVLKAFQDDHFSYIFHRGMNNKNPSLMELSIRNAVSSPNFISMIRDISGVNISVMTTMFLSKYKTGHFLSPHSDKGNGKLAAIINLTPNWKPQYGGALHILSNDRSEIIETFIPGFNNIILFSVEDEEVDNSHFVGHVANNVLQTRFAITSWYT